MCHRHVYLIYSYVVILFTALERYTLSAFQFIKSKWRAVRICKRKRLKSNAVMGHTGLQEWNQKQFSLRCVVLVSILWVNDYVCQCHSFDVFWCESIRKLAQCLTVNSVGSTNCLYCYSERWWSSSSSSQCQVSELISLCVCGSMTNE